MIIRPMKSGEAADIADLVSAVFDKFVAPQFSMEGIAEFKKFIRVDALTDRVSGGNLVLLAESQDHIDGIIEIRDNSHIALLFVRAPRQRQGIARELIHRSIEICRQRQPDLQSVSVNASPNAFAAYEKIGFEKIEDEKVVNGIRFIPMAFELAPYQCAAKSKEQ